MPYRKYFIAGAAICLSLFVSSPSRDWARAAAAIDADDLYEKFSSAVLDADDEVLADLLGQDVECEGPSIRCSTNHEIVLQALDELSLSENIDERQTVANFIQRYAARLADANDQQWLQAIAAQAHSGQPQTRDAGITSALPAASTIHDLAFAEPNLDKFDHGHFVGHPRVFMFCRSDRTYPCLMVIKDQNGNFERASDGTLWEQPSLGYSRHKRPYNQPNGNTPSGVFRIDGPMPQATKPLGYGKFRRLRLNFVAASPAEVEQLYLLPPSSQNETWWHEAVVARDMGRGLFRIHGTGLPSLPGTHYYPFVPTSGCVAKRENTHSGIKYVDQHLFLRELMIASGLTPTADNELKIRGLLYIVNINDKHAAVTPKDLAEFGIK